MPEPLILHPAPSRGDTTGWIVQPADQKRCLCCDRWGGRREARPERDAIAYDPADDRGPCVGGPWDGTLRGPRNACGRWLKWKALPPAPEEAA